MIFFLAVYGFNDKKIAVSRKEKIKVNHKEKFLFPHLLHKPLLPYFPLANYPSNSAQSLSERL